MDGSAALWIGLLSVAVLTGCALHSGEEVALSDRGDRVDVMIDGRRFTSYLYTGRARPILYPIIGPGETPMTRRYPIESAAPDEATDHPHHESLWYAHGSVNGIDFWTIGDGRGRIVTTEVRFDAATNSVSSGHDWIGPDGSHVMSDETRVVFSQQEGARVIDYDIELRAMQGDVTFGDTKEGTMAIRSHPALRLRGDAATGQALNSEGTSGREVWGRRAKWVTYWGRIGGVPVGFAIFDHPSNPRHPTWWHARDYGLIAANPFGAHDFEGAAHGSGDLVLPAGESIRFRYRFVFYMGDPQTAQVAAAYDRYAAQIE